MLSTTLRDDPTPYYICGTAIVNPEESESKVGRIVIFSYSDSKLIQVRFFKMVNYRLNMSVNFLLNFHICALSCTMNCNVEYKVSLPIT